MVISAEKTKAMLIISKSKESRLETIDRDFYLNVNDTAIENTNMKNSWVLLLTITSHGNIKLKESEKQFFLNSQSSGKYRNTCQRLSALFTVSIT